jgi:glycosyltransferase involved in cell wall biosynthesis
MNAKSIDDEINGREPLISIIIPVYNVEKYLDNCLHSILNQTLRDIEIICVDDGSTGAESEILDYYAELDKRVKVVKLEHKGVSVARNVGMQLATAPYIMFCDSDDTYNLEMCEKMLAGIQSSGADCAVCGVAVSYSDDFVGTKDNESIFDINVSGLIEVPAEDILKMLVVVWNKIFRRDLIQKYNLQFVEGIYFEDGPFWIAYGLIGSKIFFIPDKLYNYNRCGGSITSNALASKTFLRFADYLYGVIWFYDWLNANHLYEKYTQYYWNHFLHTFNSLFSMINSTEGKELICSVATDFLNKVSNQSDAEREVVQSFLNLIEECRAQSVSGYEPRT